jgi:hypothetical protein
VKMPLQAVAEAKPFDNPVRKCICAMQIVLYSRRRSKGLDITCGGRI